MDTDTLRGARLSDEADDTAEPRRLLLDLSATQLVGGALAAATAAALGARLGLAGTITGATLASVLTALASAIYTASLRRGRDRVRAVVNVRLRADGSLAGTRRANGMPSSAAPPPPGLLPTPTSRTQRAGRRLRPRVVLLGAGAILVTALAGITGFEVVAGHALSGGGATTVQQLGGEKTSKTKKPPSTAPATRPSTTATPTPTAGPTATTGPTATPTGPTTTLPPVTTPPSSPPPTSPAATDPVPPTAATTP